VPGQTLTTEAFVIEKRPPTDSFQGFTLFSPEHGNLRVLQRVPRRPAPTHTAPDLFDDVAVMLESSNQGRTWFVKEVRIATRRAAIGRSYDALRFASALAALVGRNPVHEESREQVGLLLRTALDAFGTGVRPDVVHLKSLYLFARDEGYPVKQEWLPALDEAGQAAATAILNRPVGAQSETPETVTRLRRSLEQYLGDSTEIVIP